MSENFETPTRGCWGLLYIVLFNFNDETIRLNRINRRKAVGTFCASLSFYVGYRINRIRVGSVSNLLATMTFALEAIE